MYKLTNKQTNRESWIEDVCDHIDADKIQAYERIRDLDRHYKKLASFEKANEDFYVPPSSTSSIPRRDLPSSSSSPLSPAFNQSQEWSMSLFPSSEGSDVERHYLYPILEFDHAAVAYTMQEMKDSLDQSIQRDGGRMISAEKVEKQVESIRATQVLQRFIADYLPKRRQFDLSPEEKEFIQNLSIDQTIVDKAIQERKDYDMHGDIDDPTRHHTHSHGVIQDTKIGIKLLWKEFVRKNDFDFQVEQAREKREEKKQRKRAKKKEDMNEN